MWVLIPRLGLSIANNLLMVMVMVRVMVMVMVRGPKMPKNPDFHVQMPPRHPRIFLLAVKVLGSLHLIVWKCPKLFFGHMGALPNTTFLTEQPTPNFDHC